MQCFNLLYFFWRRRTRGTAGGQQDGYRGSVPRLAQQFQIRADLGRALLHADDSVMARLERRAVFPEPGPVVMHLQPQRLGCRFQRHFDVAGARMFH